MTGTDPELVQPHALTVRFRLDGAGHITQLDNGTWSERTVGQALAWMRRSQRRRAQHIVLEVETVTVDHAEVIDRFRRQNVLIVEIGPRPFPAVSSSLLTAAIERRWDEVEAQVAYGADPAVRDAGGNTLLHYAAAGGSLVLVRALVDSGVPVSWRNQAERRAEDIARERDHHAIATWLACRELASPVERPRLSRWHRIRSGRRAQSAPAAVDDGHLVLADGRRLATEDITALAASGPWATQSGSGDVVVLGTTSGGTDRPSLVGLALSAADREDLAAHAKSFEIIRFDPFELDLLVRLLPPLLERGVPIGRVAHRYVEHRGWTEIRSAAGALRNHPTWRLPASSIPAEPPPGSPSGVAVFPNGHVGARWRTLDGSQATTWTTIEGLIETVRAMAPRREPLAVDADETFPWVASVVERLRMTGVDLASAPISGDEQPPSLANALLFHIGTGRHENAIDLIRSGWDVEAGDPWARGPLAYAVATEATEVARALLEAGADPLSPDDAGRTPLSLATATWGETHPLVTLLASARR